MAKTSGNAGRKEDLADELRDQAFAGGGITRKTAGLAASRGTADDGAAEPGGFCDALPEAAGFIRVKCA
jgi:hypothetical protein